MELFKSFDEAEHPRGKGGRFTSKFAADKGNNGGVSPGIKKLISLFEECKNSLTDEEEKFVEEKKKGCEARTETVRNKITGKEYSGTFYVHPQRQLLDKEKYMATLLASLGFEVYMVEELSSVEGKKIDAIVNGIPVDFKDVGLGNNAIKDNYQRGMRKENCKSVIIRIEKEIKYSVRDENGEKTERPLDEAVRSWTKPSNNGILVIWIDNLEDFKTYDMKKIRADNESALTGRSPCVTRATYNQDNTLSKNVNKENSNYEEKKKKFLKALNYEFCKLVEREKRREAYREAYLDKLGRGYIAYLKKYYPELV